MVEAHHPFEDEETASRANGYACVVSSAAIAELVLGLEGNEKPVSGIIDN